MTETESAGDLPEGRVVLAEPDKPIEPRDGTWAYWKIAAEHRWIRENGGLLTVEGGFNPHTFPALLKTKLIAGAIGRGRRSSAKAADGYAATYLVIEASMNRRTKHSEIGLELVASRARISVRAASNAAQRAHLLGLWIKSERHGDDGEWTSNRYDFNEAKNAEVLGKEATSVLYAVKLIIKPRQIASRPSARMVVLVWVLDQIVLTQASASFTLAELVRGTGLQRRAAEKALNSLLADGTFVKIGEGTLTLPEGVSSEHGRCRVDGPLWTSTVTHPAFAKRKAKIVSETADVRTPDNADGTHESADGAVLETSYGQPETAYGALETADGTVLETTDGALESAYGLPETAYILPEGSLAEKNPEGANNSSQSACSILPPEKDEPQSHPSVSDVPSSPHGGDDDVVPTIVVKDDAWKPANPTEAAIDVFLRAPIPDDVRLDGIRAVVAGIDLKDVHLPECEPGVEIGSQLFMQQMLWASGRMAAQLCDDFFCGRCGPPDLSNDEETATILEMMARGILAESEPTRNAIAVIKLAARAYKPTVVFGVTARILLTLFEAGDRNATWSDVGEILTNALAKAKDDDLMVVSGSPSEAVDELSQSRADVEALGLTPQPEEVNHAREL